MTELILKRYRESWESQNAAGRFNPASVVKPVIKGVKRRHVLTVGSNDSVSFWLEGETLYVLSINHGLDYVGLTAYSPEDRERDEGREIFCQGQEYYAELLGPRGLDLTERTIAKRLAAFVEEMVN